MKDTANKNEIKVDAIEIDQGSETDSKLLRENREWQRVFDALPNFMCTVDMDGTITRANKAMIARFSPEHGDLTGKDYLLTLCGTKTPDHTHANATVIGDDPSFWLETELPFCNGWYRLVSSPMFDDDGKQIGAVCIITDISERKQAELKLIRFRAALDSSLDNIYLIDRAKMRFVDANRAGWINLGYTKDEILELGLQDISREHDLDRFTDLFDQIAGNNGNAAVIGATFLRKDGSEFPVEISLRALELTQPMMIIAAARDVSEHKRYEQELIEAKEVAEEANQAKTDFLSLMSHELRTPLNAIMGFGQLLLLEQAQPLSSSQKTGLEEIVKAGEHLLSLINDILDLATLEAGRIHLSMETVSVAAIFKDCQSLIAPLASKRGIGIDMDSALQSKAMLAVDPTRFKQILLNLISNAVKYNLENGSVTIKLSDDIRGLLKISIIDTGPGIPQARRKELFIPFNRLNVSKTNTEGTGIGLVITKSLVELMGGRIGYEPVQGGGSCFWFEFPVPGDQS